jgi:hypothetical protein
MAKDSDKINELDKRVTAIEKFIEKDGLSKNGRLVHCDGFNKKTKKPCEYSWITKSKMDLVSCPKCGKKVKLEN